MCEPTLILSAVAQGAGIAAQNRAANRAQQQQALLMRDNKTRNRALEDQQAAAIQEALNVATASATTPGIEAAGNQLSEILKAAITNRRAPSGESARSAPKVFMDQREAASLASMMKSQADAQNLAKLDATNRYLSQTIQPKIADAAASGMLTGNFVRGNANVLDTGMRAAQSMANSPLAQILQGAGKVGVGYSLYEPD